MDFPGFRRIGEITVSLKHMNWIAGAVSLVLVVLCLIVHEVFFGWKEPEPIDALWWLVGIPVMFASHELLHGVGYVMFGRLAWSEVKFGVNRKAWVLFCNCLAPVRKTPFIASALLPVIILFPVSVFIWMSAPNLLTVSLSAMTLASACGDLMMTLKMVSQPNSVYVVEHPCGIGGNLFVRDDASMGGCSGAK